MRDHLDTCQLGGSSLDILEDRSGRLTITDVTSSRLSGSFKPSQQPIPNFGMTNSTFWFRFTVDGRMRSDEQWVLLLDQPLMHEVDLYIPRGDGSFEVKSSGYARPMNIREIRNKNIVLPLPLDHTPQTLYLRAWIPGRAQFPLTVMTRDAFQRYDTADKLLVAATSGFFVAMILVGLALLAFVRERNFLLFVVYISNVLLTITTIKGYHYDWFLPEHPILHHNLVLLCPTLMILASLLFTRSFLRTGEHAPQLDRMLLWLACLCSLLVIGNVLIPPLHGRIVTNMVLMASTIFSLAAALACYRKGFSPARYFLFSRIAVYIGVFYISLINFNLLPISLPTNVLPLIFALDAAFIALALGDRFKMQKDQISELISELRQSERKFRSLAENSPDNIIRYDNQCRRTYVNPTILSEFRAAPEQLLGKTPSGPYPEGWMATGELEDRIREVLESGAPKEIEIAVPHSSGSPQIHHIRLAAERDENGNIAGVVAIGRDITDRKRRELLEKARLRLFERLAQGTALPDLLAHVAAFVETAAPHLLACIMLADTEGKHLLTAAAPHLPAYYLAAIHNIEIGEESLSCGTAAWSGETVIVEEIASHPFWASHREPALRVGLQSCWSEPVFESSGKTAGAVDVYQRQPGAPSEDDRELLRQAAHLAAIVIEHKMMEKQLRYSEHQFRTLAENVPDIIIRYNRECRRIYVNPAYERETGFPAVKALNVPLETHWRPTMPVEDYRATLRQVMETGNAAEVLLEWTKSDGQLTIRDVHLVAERDRDGRIIGCLAIDRDISRLKDAERRLTKLAETSPGIIFSFLLRADGTSCMPYVSPLIKELNGLSPEDMAKDMSEAFARIHPDDFPRVYKSIAESARSLSPWHSEFRARHPEKGEIWMEGHSIPERQGDGGTLWYGFLHDITERKRIEESLRRKREQLTAMTLELSLAEERERLRIAAELHDQIGQTLLLGRIKLGSVADTQLPESARKLIEEARELLDQATHDAHSLTVQLNPPILAAAGLEAALEWLGKRMEADYGLHVEFENDMKEKPLIDELRSIVYQCGRELLINVAKHAMTDHARLIVSQNDSMFQLTVEDEGAGFDPAALVPDISNDCKYGLFSIQTKIERLGGEVVIHSAPGQGSRITILVPSYKRVISEAI